MNTNREIALGVTAFIVVYLVIMGIVSLIYHGNPWLPKTYENNSKNLPSGIYLTLIQSFGVTIAALVTIIGIVILD